MNLWYSVQDPDEIFDNPIYLEEYERHVIEPRVKQALLKREISGPEEKRTFETRLWDKYYDWLLREIDDHRVQFQEDER